MVRVLLDLSDLRGLIRSGGVIFWAPVNIGDCLLLVKLSKGDLEQKMLGMSSGHKVMVRKAENGDIYLT